jgi:2',3'-cyclic-nucleotide 2'-phosphodiesterase (5'-nucleotidase family)
MRLRILHTNDFHGKLSPEKFEYLVRLRKSVDFYFDCGDAIKTGNVGIPLVEDPVWKYFAQLDCTAGVVGNREFHISEAAFRAKISGCTHPLLAANLHYRQPKGNHLQNRARGVFALMSDQPLASGMIVGELGIFGLMVPMVTERMSSRHLSAFINSDPIEAGIKCVERLRGRVKKIICISHLGLRRDVELAEKIDGIDLILGGHSHDLIDPPAKLGGTVIAQAASHGRFAAIHDIADSGIKTTYEPLP